MHKLVKELIKDLLPENYDFNSTLREAKNVGTVYYFTNLVKTNSILSKNEIAYYEGNREESGLSEIDIDEALIPGTRDSDEMKSFKQGINYYLKQGINKLYYLSTTRNKFFHKKNPNIQSTYVRFTLDGNKLNTKYKINPFYFYSEEMVSTDVAPKDFHDESEERVLLGTKTVIPNFTQYVLGIDIMLDELVKRKDTRNLYKLEDYIDSFYKAYPNLKLIYQDKPISKEEFFEKILPSLSFDEDEDDIYENTIPTLGGIDHEFKDALISLVQYMIEQDMNILPLPSLKIIDNDVKNANNILGKTAHYDPNNCSITLYTLNRHPKDILRSFAHEMIHRIQDNEGRLNNINTTDTNEDGDLPELEKEAYLLGNMTIRKWEDGIKNQKYINEYRQYALNELFEKDLPNIEKISPTKYIVSNGNDIEAEYFFKVEFDVFDENPTSNNWSINWKFTDNNQNTSPEAWKQVTATSFRVLNNFIQEKKPKSITISGNTEQKTNLYKSKSFLEKLENLFNNQYKINNSDEDKVVMNLIESIHQSSIKKRMETLNESYDQALNYWQNGDTNAKSKIERWDSIKRKVKREVLQELYKIKNV
jgi:hypothetical protein